MESTAKIYISNSYQGNLNFHRHRISYTLFLVTPIYQKVFTLKVVYLMKSQNIYITHLDNPY